MHSEIANGEKPAAQRAVEFGIDPDPSEAREVGDQAVGFQPRSRYIDKSQSVGAWRLDHRTPLEIALQQLRALNIQPKLIKLR